MTMIFLALQMFFLVFALAVDTFVCSLAYGLKQIKMTFKAMIIISLVSTALLSAGVFLTTLITPFLPEVVMVIFSFLILLAIGLAKIFEGLIRRWIKKQKKVVNFTLFNFAFVLQVYADYELADLDASNDLSWRESLPLALALGLDGFAVGLAMGAVHVNLALLSSLTFFVNIIFMLLGYLLGRKIGKLTEVDFSILSGATLIIIGVLNLIFWSKTFSHYY